MYRAHQTKQFQSIYRNSLILCKKSTINTSTTCCACRSLGSPSLSLRTLYSTYSSKKSLQEITNNSNIVPSYQKQNFSNDYNTRHEQSHYTALSFGDKLLHSSSINNFQWRNLHISRVLDEKNKVEDYVIHKRRKLERDEKLKYAAQKFQEAFIFKVDRSLAVDSPDKAAAESTVTVKKPLKERIVNEIKHYYNGFRLLYLDSKIAARLLWQVMNGNSLSRRERKQFLRTAADLFRLVPFTVFLIVPFMEFFLPVVIKLFPNMLPSTFEDKDKKKAQSLASLKMRLQMSEFLQDTIEEIAVTTKSKKPSKKLIEFADFVTKIRSEGEIVRNQEIMKFSKLFEDEITLENIQHDQLKAMCRLMMISPIGTSNFLRFKIRMKLQELKADDVMINREGLDSLSVEELQNACIARGMRSMGVPIERLKSNLRQWLELSLNEDIPSSLLLLSRTLYMSPNVAVDEQLKVTISQLPERLIDEMEVKIGAVEGEAVDRQTIIDIIKHEEAQIAAEKEEILKKKEEELKAEKIMSDELLKEDIVKVQETLSTERDELLKIQEHREKYIGDAEELKQVELKVMENIASTRLGKRIDAMLAKVDSSLKDLESDVMNLPKGKIDLDDDGIVTTEEIFQAVRKLRNAPDEAKTQRLIEVLDQDSDGELDLNELRQAIQLLAKEDLGINQEQITEVLALLEGSKKIFVIEQIINKKKSNYLLQILPRVYSHRYPYTE